MLSAIKDLGRLVIKEEEKDALDIFVEDPNITGNYTKVITIEIKLALTGCEFSGVSIENYESKKKMKYLYRRGAPSGADFSPMAKISSKPVGTFERKILGWFRVLDNKNISLQESDKRFLEDLQQILTENEDEIKEKILNFRKTIPKKERLLLTLKIGQQGQMKYVGEFPVIVDLFLQLIKEKEQEFTIQQKVCSLCGLKKENILGNINTYAFYTIDKPGFITGNFNESKSWRNFPVCEECKLGLDEGKAYLKKNLTFKFCGIPYNLVPKFIVGYDDISREVVEIFANSSKLVSLREKRIDSITGDEEEILAELAKIDDILTLNFLFIQ
ncbi:MAG: TIGR02556 family CRISPR-associated protein, partial [Bacteroidales bacterium]|nr:TIGR02556 family CRISPR-associated protein [Bacteroidales bacterium]